MLFGDGVLDLDIVDKGIHTRADIGGIFGILVACGVDAQTGGDAVPHKGHSIKVVLRYGSQHRHGRHTVVGTEKAVINGLRHRCGGIPNRCVHSGQDAARLGGGRCCRRRGCGLRGGFRHRRRLSRRVRQQFRCGFRGRRFALLLIRRVKVIPTCRGQHNCQHDDQNDHHAAFAASACDLIAIGVKIGHGTPPQR